MVKTTVYLPEDLKYALTQVAERRGESEAELIRVAVRSLVEAEPRPQPRGGLFKSSHPGVSRNVEEALRGTDEIPGLGEW